MQTDCNQNEIALYAAPDGSIKLDVRIDAETVWLTQRQMAELFGTTVFNVNVHLKNIYDTQELGEAATIEEFSIVRREGNREVKRQIKHYNLDAIIGVGYRVNSKRGTQFRIWATQRLRDHLVKGFTVNKPRLEQRGLVEIENTVKLLGRTLNAHGLIGNEGQALLDLVEHYTRSWRLLLQYDENRLPAEPAAPTRKMARLTLAQANQKIAKFKKALESKGEASSLFGAPRSAAQLSKPSAESSFTQMWRRARRISSILSSRTIPLPTATSGSAACYFCTTLTKTGGSSASTGSRASTTGLLWHWRSSLPKALLVRRTA
jgi:hypothetical protein